MAMNDLHLADLHERARELDVPGYRMLTRDELIEAIEGGEGKETPKKRGTPRKRRAPKKREEPRERVPEEELETEDVSGVLDRMPQGYGFLRLEGLEPAEGDVYVSASQIRRCELRPGDEVAGPARAPRSGERHRALVRVASVNGGEPEGDRTQFEELTPKAPHREIPNLDSIELPEPLSYGERALVLAGEAPAASELLRELAGALKGNAGLLVLLAGPSAEDPGDWRDAASEDEVVAGEEMDARERVRAAELSMGRAKRRVEQGEDVVVLVDSLSSLADGYRDVSRVKRIFGAGRELAEEGSGSLTMIAAVVAADERSEDVQSALEGTEDVVVKRD
jgi:transcription termination factor Rho